MGLASCLCGNFCVETDNPNYSWMDGSGREHMRNRCGSPVVTSEPKAPNGEAITAVCDEVKALLLAKNQKYGGSALNPARVFSKASAIEQILVRIDDKISRIQTTGQSAPDEDTVMDLIGYLVLLRVAQREAKP
jgi:hypothetical protein